MTAAPLPIRPRVLVVDDEDQVRRLLVRVLERGGYACTAAADADEARAHLVEHAFELMLCDLHMPGGSGLELLGHVHAGPGAPATLVVTGDDDHALAERAVAGGAYGFVVKPFRATELLASVHAAVRRRQRDAHERRRREQLEAAVAERTAELRHVVAELERSREETIQRHMRALDARNE